MSSAEFFGQKPTTFDPFTGGITVRTYVHSGFISSLLPCPSFISIFIPSRYSISISFAIFFY